MQDTNWFRRLAEVPGVSYSGHAEVDRRKLPGHDLQPEVFTFGSHERQQNSLLWETQEGSSSQSPASRWGLRGDLRRAATVSVLRIAYEALELPGTISDYHFVLLLAVEALWGRRRQDPDTLADLERLCLLDISLVEAHPEILRIDGGDETSSIRVPAFQYLTLLYERDGFLGDALAIARRGSSLGQTGSDVEQLEGRVAAARAESAQ